MAFHSKKEFAELCGMVTNALSVYIKRGKVILSGEFVDGELLQNKEFLKKWSEKNGVKQPVAIDINPDIKTKEPKIDKPKRINNESDDGYASPGGLYALDKEKKTLDIEKTAEEIQLLKVKNEKARAVVVPTELVKALFSQHTKSILVEFSNSVDNIITKISKKKALSNNEVAEIRKELIEEINIAVDKSIDESKKNIKNLMNEYSEKKGVGERI